MMSHCLSTFVTVSRTPPVVSNSHFLYPYTLNTFEMRLWLVTVTEIFVISSMVSCICFGLSEVYIFDGFNIVYTLMLFAVIALIWGEKAPGNTVHIVT